MKKAVYGAIDIGSNAVRLLISTVYYDKEGADFRKTSLIRFPIRLGEDVFVHGKISKEKEEKIIDAMSSYALAMKVYGIEHYFACATSAMRNASNGKDIVKKVKETSGIQINIIHGHKEAEFIAATNFTSTMKEDKDYLYVDVGGGSTEFTFYSQGKVVDSASFKIGTVRILHNVVEDGMWEEAEKWVRKITYGHDDITIIGSGGNINTINKANKAISKDGITKEFFVKYAKMLAEMTNEERITKLKFKHDRADVIVPASKIYMGALEWSGAQKIQVPKIGLVDGIVKTLHAKYSK